MRHKRFNRLNLSQLTTKSADASTKKAYKELTRTSTRMVSRCTNAMMEDSTQELLLGCSCPQPPRNISTPRTDPESLDVNTTKSGSSTNAGTTSLTLHVDPLVHQTNTTTPNNESKEQCFVNLHLLKAINLNYEGVCLLQSGEDEEKAIAVLKRSLVCVNKSALASDKALSTFLDTAPGGKASKESQNLDDKEKSRTRRNSPDAVVQTPLVVSSPPEDSNHCIIDDQHHHPMIVVPVEIHKPNSLDDLLYVYTKAFVFQTSHAGNQGEPAQHAHLLGPCCSIVDSELLSATIIYNIGLALQIKAIRANSLFLRRKSLALYEMSMGLLHRILKAKDNDSNNDDGSSDHVIPFQADLTYESMSILTTLLIACCNNAGHLSYYMQDYERSHRTMKNLQFLLRESHKRRLVSTPSSSSSSWARRRPLPSFFRLLEDDDILGFTWNVTFMHPPTTAAAA